MRAGGTDLFGEEDRKPKPIVECLEPDMVNHPSHYTSGSIECIDAMIETQGTEAVKGYCKCNAFKYLWRHAFKNGEEDIDKAVWYLNKYVELRDGIKSEEIFEDDREIKTPTPSSYNGAFCSEEDSK